MDMTLLSILAPAMVAGILVLSTHVVLGRQVLKRGIIFIDLAIAQFAALGAVLAHTLHAHHDHGSHADHAGHGAMIGLEFLLPALFALVAAALIAALERYFKPELEALIGSLYVVSAVAAMLLLSGDPHGGELLHQILSGQILWTGWGDLILPALLSLLVLALILFWPQSLHGPLFYLMFALVIPFSVQLVGVYLVFSSLILPALAVNQLQGRRAQIWGLITGITGYGIGLWLSAGFDLPSGATVVVTLAAVAILVRVVVRPK
ncbi:zinc/manganese transport system permease protein [Ferrimonas marina]|uniref:Zinc/manganese transport system permease protein n=2 Tax=Ferrimonas marina TaxID=299255 RepID=A0A1M5XC08_9GAMM|nr:zinc/manganese transport system permease protein [Ferrimonas marina]